MRAHDSGEIRIKALPVGRAHNLLENHRHLFFFQAVGRGAHILLCMLAEGRRVDALDRFHQLFRPKADVAALIGQHEGFVHARERLVLRVLQQAGRTYGERITDFFEKFSEVFPKAAR